MTLLLVLKVLKKQPTWLWCEGWPWASDPTPPPPSPPPPSLDGPPQSSWGYGWSPQSHLCWSSLCSHLSPCLYLGKYFGWFVDPAFLSPQQRLARFSLPEKKSVSVVKELCRDYLKRVIFCQAQELYSDSSKALPYWIVLKQLAFIYLKENKLLFYEITYRCWKGLIYFKVKRHAFSSFISFMTF